MLVANTIYLIALVTWTLRIMADERRRARYERDQERRRGVPGGPYREPSVARRVGDDSYMDSVRK